MLIYNKTNSIEDTNITFHKDKKYQFQKLQLLDLLHKKIIQSKRL